MRIECVKFCGNYFAVETVFNLVPVLRKGSYWLFLQFSRRCQSHFSPSSKCLSRRLHMG